MTETREIVVPGEVVASAGALRPGQNTYQEGDKILALRLGVKTVRGDRVNVISLSGRYEPFRGDMVIGTVAELGPSNWYVNIGAANDVGMHVNDVPWRVEFGETSKYLAVGDTVLLKIVHVDEMKKAQVSMKDRQCRKLTGGLILDVQPTKVPRIVGRNGSMISMLKDATNVRVFVGQNGVIWMDGEADDVQLALEALRKIEEEAHTTGLTDRMKAWLEERRPSAHRPKRDVAEEPAAEDEAPREERPPRERRERSDRGERRERGGGGRFGDRERRPAPPRAFADEPPRDERPRHAPRDEDVDERPRPAPRRFGDEPTEGRVERRPPFRSDVEERPPRRPRFEESEERPARRPRFEEPEERPRPATRPRFEEDERPRPSAPRRFDEEERPARRPRFEPESDDAPVRRAPPPPMRRTDDEDDDGDERPAERPSGGGGEGGFGGGRGRRGRRGGRGRGRGGRKED